MEIFNYEADRKVEDAWKRSEYPLITRGVLFAAENGGKVSNTSWSLAGESSAVIVSGQTRIK